MSSIALKMKAIIFLAIIAFAAADSDYYNLEKLDMEELANNLDEFKSFVDCLLDRKECSKLYATFRAVTDEAVEQLCKRCTPFQKHAFWLFLQGLKARLPEDYYNFKQKFDPENKYFESLESELKKYQTEF